MKSCNEYYKRRIANVLTSCNKLASDKSELDTMPPVIDCVSYTTDGKDDPEEVKRVHAGRCETIRRHLSQIPPLEIDGTEERWNRHRKKISDLKKLNRQKRFIPIIATAALVLSGVSLGNDHWAIKLGNHNAENTERLTNRTNENTESIIEMAEVLSDFRSAEIAFKTWAHEVEEKVDELISMRGLKTNLTTVYTQWIDAQSTILNEINWAARQKKVPASIKPMLNLTDSFPTTNWSTLFDCSYKLVNRTLVLNLDFTIPIIDQNMEILEVNPMSFYNIREVSNATEYCWNEYIGPLKLLQNKTDGCLTKLDEKRVSHKTVRAQTCIGSKNLYEKDEVWEQQICTSELPMDPERIQITEQEGTHRIYCYPFKIEIEGISEQCPIVPFTLPGYVNYNIGNISHSGSFIDASATRHVRSTRLTRKKRSPAIAAITTSITAESTIKSTEAPVQKQDIVKTIDKITGRVNNSLAKIQLVLNKLSKPLNITRAQLESIFNEPFEFIGGAFNSLLDFFKTLGITIGIISSLMMMIAIVPMLEIFIIGLKIAKIPANIWLSSAKRVVNQMQQFSKLSLNGIRLPGLRGPVKRMKRKWEVSKFA